MSQSCTNPFDNGRLAFYIFISTTLLYAPPLLAIETVSLDPERSYYVLGKHLMFREDKTLSLSINDVLRESKEQFWRRINKDIPSFGFTKAAYWFAVRLAAPRHPNTEWLLEISYPLLDEVSLYTLSGDIMISEYTSGDKLPFLSRQIDNRNFVFPLKLHANQQITLVLRVATQGAMQIPIKLWRAPAFHSKEQKELLWQGIFYGVMLALIFYNFFLFISIRETAYLLYVLWVSFSSAFQASLHGFGYQYLWPNSTWLQDKGLAMFTALAVLFAALFGSNFLNLQNLNPIIYRALIVIGGGIVVLLVLVPIIPYQIAIQVIIATLLPTALLLLFAGYQGWARGDTAARYFSIAWTTLLATAFVSTLNKFGVIPRLFFTEIVQVGAVIEVLLLSFALAEKINTEKRVRLQTQRQLLKIQRRATENLEKTVKARTKELEHALFKLSETNQKLSTATLAAQAANKAKSVFLATMSHELRTPLNAILGYAQILQRCPNLDSTQSEGLNVIKRCGKHLLTLIDDILDLSKIEAQRLKLYSSRLHFPTFIEDITAIIGLEAEQKGIQFRYKPSDNLPVLIEADEKRLRQTLFNLLRNAVKFTDEGTVMLRVQRITQSVSNMRARLLFEVEDTGVGITHEDQQMIFNPFEQAGDERRRKEGTGLGLAISLQLVKLMGGNLQVDSKPGKGSCFRFELILPVVQANSQPVGTKQKEVVGYKGKRRRILVVDDNEDNRLVLVHLLRPMGFAVFTAPNGQTGIDEAMKIRPDLILMDLIMPGLSGFEAVQILRQQPQTQDVAIIGVSANPFEIEKAKNQATGFNSFLSKPIEEEKLFSKLDRYLSLNWIYKREQSSEEKFECSSAPSLIAPPSPELEHLRRLATLGKTPRIQEWAIQLEQTDQRYIPFAQNVLALARAFEDEKIVALVERFRKEQTCT